MKDSNALNHWMSPAFPVYDIYGDFSKEVILESQLANNEGLVEMELQVKSFSALDDQGNEHQLLTFGNSQKLKLASLETGTSIKTKSIRKLPAGSYAAFRFYLGNDGHEVTNQNRNKRALAAVEYLDFAIQGGLDIKAAEQAQLVMRFDFPMYAVGALSNYLAESLRKLRNVLGGRKVSLQTGE